MSEQAIWAWQVFDSDGKWGTIAAVVIPGLSAQPLIARSTEVADRMRPLAQGHSITTGKRVRLARYDFTTELEVLEPE